MNKKEEDIHIYLGGGGISPLSVGDGGSESTVV